MGRFRNMQDKPVKVQAREVRRGYLVVGSRTSPIKHGALIKDTWRVGNNRVVAAVEPVCVPGRHAKRSIFFDLSDLRHRP